MAENERNATNWKAIKSWLVGITSVIVVIPALLNAGLDLYNTIMDIPRTKAEKNNTELFSKHFNQEPVVSLPVPVRQGAATYDVRFSIYKEGDVFVEYGDMTQWFPFPSTRGADSSPFTFVSAAYADEPRLNLAAAYKQSESIEGSYLIREKKYQGGLLEKQVIDMKTGRIVESEKNRADAAAEAAAEEPAPEPSPAPSQQIISPFAVIDLNAIKSENPQNATATTCRTAQGNCTLLRAVTPGNECSCPSSAGEIKGTAQ